MKDRFKFRAVMKTDELCIVVPVEAVHSTYYIIDTDIAKEIFDKKYPEKCFFSDFLEIIDKQDYISQYSFDCDLLITKDFTNLMQCTGLKDKNGKLIFEGDIVMYSGKAGIIKEISSTLVCYWLKDYLSNDGWYNYLPYFEHNDIKLEVVGNIYENPELLKGGV